MIQQTNRLVIVCLAVLCYSGVAHAQTASNDLARANEILTRWVGRKDISSSLIVGTDDRWSIRTMAADLYPGLVLAAWFTNLDLYHGLLRETLKDEERLTARLTVFPDDYHVRNHRFVRSSRNVEEILINAAAYADGLSRIATVVGPSPWTDRLRGIVDALFLRADVATDYSEGALPSDDLRVLGRVLKALPLLAHLYDDEGYLYYARRIADAYCVGVMPKNGGLPAERWNFASDRARASSLILEEDGVAFIEGLVGLYEVEVRTGTARADVYRPTLSAMFDALFSQGLKPGGRFHRRLQPDGRGGYSIDRKRESPFPLRILLAAHRYGQLSGNQTYVNTASSGLSSFKPDAETAHRMLPDLIRAARISPEAAARISALNITSLADTPSIDWDETADAAALRALLATAWRRSGGLRAQPWRQDVVVSSTASDAGVRAELHLETPWRGQLLLPTFAPYTASTVYTPLLAVDPDTDYRIQSEAIGSDAIWIGSALRRGLNVDVETPIDITIRPIVPETAPPTP